ncbi:MAG: hypothetical protein J6C82_05095 [Clostridia bacterium]|nr:hypothetical protein [Clostridia bacterium]
MAREQPNYRSTLEMLIDKGYPMSLTRGEAAKILCLSYKKIAELIKKGFIKEKCGKIPLGSVANYLCG